VKKHFIFGWVGLLAVRNSPLTPLCIFGPIGSNRKFFAWLQQKKGRAKSTGSNGLGGLTLHAKSSKNLPLLFGDELELMTTGACTPTVSAAMAWHE
jgi:hypothetical protein